MADLALDLLIALAVWELCGAVAFVLAEVIDGR